MTDDELSQAAHEAAMQILIEVEHAGVPFDPKEVAGRIDDAISDLLEPNAKRNP
jgi:hypothetical protein